MKVTGDPASSWEEVARVLCGPAAGPKVRWTDARPSASVALEASLTLPPPSAVQLMGTPGIGLPKASVTWTTRGWLRIEPAGAVWLSPERAAISLAFSESAFTVKLV